MAPEWAAVGVGGRKCSETIRRKYEMRVRDYLVINGA